MLALRTVTYCTENEETPGATGGTNKGKGWGMKQERRTPQYTTRWEDVPVARA